MLESVWGSGCQPLAHILGMPSKNTFLVIEMHKIMERIFHTKMPFHFKIFILGKVDFLKVHHGKYLFGVLISVGKKTITKHWLHPDSSPIEERTDIVGDIYSI